MHRIPGSHRVKSRMERSRKFGKKYAKRARPVVFLQHGLLCSSSDWVLNPTDRGLGKIYTRHQTNKNKTISTPRLEINNNLIVYFYTICVLLTQQLTCWRIEATMSGWEMQEAIRIRTGTCSSRRATKPFGNSRKSLLLFFQ